MLIAKFVLAVRELVALNAQAKVQTSPFFLEALAINKSAPGTTFRMTKLIDVIAQYMKGITLFPI
jgi:hypothetical protein